MRLYVNIVIVPASRRVNRLAPKRSMPLDSGDSISCVSFTSWYTERGNILVSYD